jgi:hypothetical protein
VLRGICDTPERIPARIFIALKSGCQCCTFWRAWLLGVATSGLPALLLYFVKGSP